MNKSRIFCSYAQKDRSFMERLYAHLRLLEIQGVSVWGTDDILPGMSWEQERDSHLQAADIILLLVSVDFITSNDQYTKEVLPAMERYNRGEAQVIPIILRPVQWQGTLFGKLIPLPTNGKPVVDPAWNNVDYAYLNIFQGIERALTGKQEQLPPIKSTDTSQEALRRLVQIIQELKTLRAQIARFVYLKDANGFTLEKGESQYNKLYGDTLVFLATYLATDSDAFVEAVYRKTAEQLRGRSDVFVVLTRWIISPLAKLEKLAAQIDACTATLESYKQRYFGESSS